MAKAISINKWLVAGAAGAIAWLCIHRKKGKVAGISGVSKIAQMSYMDFVSYCRQLAHDLHTIIDVREYPQYGWSGISFMTDRFGGVYVNLHYNHKTGVVTNWYGSNHAKEITTLKELDTLVMREMKRLLKSRNMQELSDFINSQY